jgi:nucleobase transporter 1/2
MSEAATTGVLYPLDSKPPAPKALILATQHVLTMFGATVAVPLLFKQPLEFEGPELAILVSSVMICSGFATAVQVLFGSRLPIIQGVSFSFLAAFFACVAFAKANPDPEISHGALSMSYIAGSIIVGSVVEIFVGYSGLVGKLRRSITPVVIGPVIMLIGLALFQFGWPSAAAHWPTGGLTIALVILFSLFLSKKSAIIRTLPILLAVLIVWTLCIVLTQAGVYGEGHSASVSFAGLGEVPWFRSNLAWGDNPVLLPWGLPRFELALIVATLAGFLASMLESIGDYHGAAAMAETHEPTDDQISKGIGAEGVGCLGTGLLGGFSSTSYSENIALIGLTRVASRYVVLIAAGLLVFLGLFAKFGGVVATIPGPIVGGLYCTLFGLIAAVGIQQTAKADLFSQRNLFIIGFSLFMGLSVPAWFADTMIPIADYSADLLTHFPPGSYIDFTQTTVVIPGAGKSVVSGLLPSGAANVVISLGSTGMGVAAIIGLILDNSVPGTDAERGIVSQEAPTV